MDDFFRLLFSFLFPFSAVIPIEKNNRLKTLLFWTIFFNEISGEILYRKTIRDKEKVPDSLRKWPWRWECSAASPRQRQSHRAGQCLCRRTIKYCWILQKSVFFRHKNDPSPNLKLTGRGDAQTPERVILQNIGAGVVHNQVRFEVVKRRIHMPKDSTKKPSGFQP